MNLDQRWCDLSVRDWIAVDRTVSVIWAVMMTVCGALGAWLFRRWSRWRERPSTVQGEAYEPTPVKPCCVSAPPSDWMERPIGYEWVCGACGQPWQKIQPTQAIRVPCLSSELPPDAGITAASAQKRP